ncbi:MAG TPA: ArsC/Spx/MgsR family protein [Verrucomicrobiae bacterium]|nr:ArsC/Spx/MgsR family protein [Verrucomicrobiae bacterium]
MATKNKKKKKKKPVKTARFLHKPNCTTCRKARAYLENRGFGLHFRDLGKERLSAAELEKLIGERDHREFLNPRNELYRERGMKDNPPSRKEAVRLMAREPNLIRRPVILCGGRVVLGFNEEAIKRL